MPRTTTERLAALLVKAQARAGKPHQHRAEEMGECPRCGYTAPLDDFDNGPEPDETSTDDYSPDDVSSATDNQDPDNSRDTDGYVRENNNRAIDRLNNLTRSMKEANRNR